MSEIDVFISHSSRDQEFVMRLITLIRSALNLQSDKIRCTSVNGFGLDGGIATDEKLKKEIHHSKAFIAVITPQSIKSTYVLFELGARWGAEKPMIPLLTCGASSDHLKSPLDAINALDASQSAQLHQFVEELAGWLDIDKDRPAAFEKDIDEVVAYSNQCNSNQDKGEPKDSGGPKDGGPEMNMKKVAPLLITIIQEQQDRFVEKSWGESAPECFTWNNLKRFKQENTIPQVQTNLRRSGKFSDLVDMLAQLPETRRNDVFQEGRDTFKETWEKIGKVTIEGQTDAGQQAEKMIAEAVVELAREQVSLRLTNWY